MTADERDRRFAAWLADHRGIAVKVARAYASIAQDQADLQQEMLLQVWRSLPSFRGQAKLSTWSYRICLNTALTWRRDEWQHRSRVFARETLPETATPAELRPGANHEESELLHRLYDAIRRLEPAARSLLLLALDGLTYREIAEVTDMTENHVGVALNRARRKLAEKMKGVLDELE